MSDLDDLMRRKRDFDQVLIEYQSYYEPIKSEDAFNALVYAYADEIEHPVEFWSADYNADDLIKHLQYYRLSHLIALYKIELDLAEEVVFRGKVRLRINGYRIDIHKNDADPWPSNPHGHIYDQNLKIDLSNGKCYRKRKYVDKLHEKKLFQIRKICVQKGITLPDLNL